MKKQTLGIVVGLFLFITLPLQSSAETTTDKIDDEKKIESAEVKLLLTRLDEIRNMDKSDMSSSEKKELRKEVRSIKRELKAAGGGIYLSAGALIIIVLLLIILL
ncbi:hypothetical protein GCM10011506_21280 [Marivirga lumbricoides]|uniref:Seryl-tRNA synthetase n=1 Tax=Marivirga lumbricoides TaxID=1046115 RepID=A0ABQ1M785_9BACT|nr:hypothetical protein GCM10011506_21280 [Marivirga lumbricoides]